jgi:hypothetical protein
VGLKCNGTHQLLVYIDDLNLLWHNINTIKKSTEAPTDASREVGLEINPDKSKYILMSCDQNARQYYNIKIANRSSSSASFFISLYSLLLTIKHNSY